jgi:hypothetical protein
MKEQATVSIANKTITEKLQYGPRGAGLLRTVTLSLPAHVVDLMEATEERLGAQRADWFICMPEQYLNDNRDLARFTRDFEELYVDGAWTFDDANDRAQFVEPILPALRKAFEAHNAKQPALA